MIKTLMIVKGKDLEFVSQIRRDGSGTDPVKESYIEYMLNDDFKLRCLSLTEKTHIATNFNSFVVKLKQPL